MSVRSREDACLACDAAHAAGGGIVDGAAEEVVEVGVGGRGAFAVVCGGGGAQDIHNRPTASFADLINGYRLIRVD